MCASHHSRVPPSLPPSLPSPWQALAAKALRAHVTSRFGTLSARPKAAHEGLVVVSAAADDGGAPLPPVAAQVAACLDGSDAAAARRARLHAHVARGVPAVAAALRSVSGDGGVVEITTANYLELLGANVVPEGREGREGREGTHAFLRDCCLGGSGWGGAPSTEADWLRP